MGTANTLLVVVVVESCDSSAVVGAIFISGGKLESSCAGACSLKIEGPSNCKLLSGMLLLMVYS